MSDPLICPHCGTAIFGNSGTRVARQRALYLSGLHAARAILYLVIPLLNALDKTLRDLEWKS